jgi:hypothetical protein
VAKAKRPPSAADERYVWPVVDQHLATLNSIADGLALVDSRIGADAGPGIPLDILAGEFPETRDILRPIRLLAEILVDGVANEPSNDSRADQRSEAIDAIKAAVEEARLRVTRRARSDALGDAADVIREVGLELHDLHCTLSIDREGKNVIVADRVPSPLADAWLIERLFERANAFMAADQNLALERTASAWFFDCWSDGMWEDDPAYTDFPRMVREQEWSLASRDTLSLDEPVIASFTTDQQPDDVPRRQQRLASAYERSTVGIFEVIAVDRSHVTVRDTSNGRTFQYYEHSEDADPYSGLLILGRMIPLEDDLWLRSPGAIIITSEGNDYRDMLAQTLTNMSETLPTPIALEGLISSAVYGATVPVSRLPAPTVAMAQATLVLAQGALEELGLLTDVAELQPPSRMLEQLESPALESFGLGVDQPVAEWLMALSEQASLDTTRPGGRAAKRKGRAKQQHTRRRKR